ncbi:HK97 family phage prohead protease [Cellulomonas oligotrophica]|uniref:Prohead serine protease domain-containing protein n=1 Tax=Cellulomonas oligotrophica TaxID=931536 RepID=A0A7Y9JZE3_9CELL|nr:HK97 family phage prohead protease [Cellulomonas oligotrophica]NYD87782.1 hypothetical protein [Cellulomonas oligotrophica]GIG33014.1 hypothetical protein Col01nite_21730 [Cellulomonas oligotrophica]
MDETTQQRIAHAAKARGEQLQADRGGRPRQRRSAPHDGSRPIVSVRSRCELRAAATDSSLLHFVGVASTYEQPYEMYDAWGPYTEVVTAGAGSASLARADLDVPLVLQHQSLRRIARTTNGTLTLAEDDGGLHVDAPALDPADPDVAYIAPKLAARLVDEMSFMFRIVRGAWSSDYTEYRIHEYDIHRGDVAIVGYGANPFTTGDLRSAPTPAVARASAPIPHRSEYLRLATF